jgi:hypothetical protein
VILEAEPDSDFSTLSHPYVEMKSRLRTRIIPRWEPDERFMVPLHRRVPIARRAPEFLSDETYPVEETWNLSTPLWM